MYVKMESMDPHCDNRSLENHQIYHMVSVELRKVVLGLRSLLVEWEWDKVLGISDPEAGEKQSFLS